MDFILGAGFGALVTAVGVVFGAGIAKMREENDSE